MLARFRPRRPDSWEQASWPPPLSVGILWCCHKRLVPESRYILCQGLSSCRCCPPEDCGVPQGFADLLQALQDANHPSYDEACEAKTPLIKQFVQITKSVRTSPVHQRKNDTGIGVRRGRPPTREDCRGVCKLQARVELRQSGRAASSDSAGADRIASAAIAMIDVLSRSAQDFASDLVFGQSVQILG